MPQCLYCLGWYLSETDQLQGSSCECGENVCEDDKRAEFYIERIVPRELTSREIELSANGITLTETITLSEYKRRYGKAEREQ